MDKELLKKMSRLLELLTEKTENLQDQIHSLDKRLKLQLEFNKSLIDIIYKMPEEYLTVNVLEQWNKLMKD